MAKVSFKKTLVALDLSIMDGFVLEYISNFYTSFGMEEIVFFHNIKDVDSWPQTEEYMAAELQAIEDIRERVSGEVAKHDFSKAKIEIHISQGPTTDVMLSYAVKARIDLLVMGRKRSLDGSGIVSSHIARKSPTSILFVTQNMNPLLRNVLVPIDFSEHAELAFKAGMQLEEKGKANLKLVNIYDVPIGYYKLGKTYEEFAEIMLGHAKNDYKYFLKKNEAKKDYECHFTVRGSQSKIDLVFEHALSSRSDLIIIGSQGRTNASAILLGSFAEKMVLRDSDIPVLIMKKEGENMSLLEAILSL